MSGELVPVREEELTTAEGRGWDLVGYRDAEWLAKTLSKSSLVPAHFRGKPADLFHAIVEGHELDIRPMAALRGSWVLKGVLRWRARVKVAIVKRSPLCLYFRRVSSDETHATYETQRRGEPEPVRFTFTIEMAKKAKLTGKDNWMAYAQQMLMARASSALADDVYPDIVEGIQTIEEADIPLAAIAQVAQGLGPEKAESTGSGTPPELEVEPVLAVDPVQAALASVPPPPAE